MPTPHYSIETVSRGSRRTLKNGSVRVCPVRLGGSAARRMEYIERGGSLTNRADEVLYLGHAGSPVDWNQVDRTEIAKNAQVARELVATVPHVLSLAAKRRIGHTHAEELSRELGVPVGFGLHKASRDGDVRNEHCHFLFPTRDAAGMKLTQLSNKRTASKIVARLRGKYQDVVNAEFVRAGINDRLDLRSRAARGLSAACQRVEKREFARARRGEIHSTKYARNQAILANRKAAEAHSNATAEVARISRAIRLAQRTGRVARRHRARRNLDFARSAACAEDRGLPRGRGGRDDQPASQRCDRPDLRGGLAGAGSGSQRQSDPEARLVVRGVANSHRGGSDFSAPNESVATWQEHAETGRVKLPVGGAMRSLAERALRWLTGTGRRETKGHAHAENTAAVPRVQSDGDAKAERALSVPQESVKCTRQEQIRIEADRRAAQALAVTQSSLPLVSIRTKSGTIFYAYRLDLITAWTDGNRDVPLCFLDGSKVKTGGEHKATLRLSTINAAEIAPCAIVELASHMRDDQNWENARDAPSTTAPEEDSDMVRGL